MKALIVNGTEYEFTDDGTADTLLGYGAIERCTGDGTDYTASEPVESEDDGDDDNADDESDEEDTYYRLVHGRTFAQKEVESLIEAFS